MLSLELPFRGVAAFERVLRVQHCFILQGTEECKRSNKTLYCAFSPQANLRLRHQDRRPLVDHRIAPPVVIISANGEARS